MEMVSLSLVEAYALAYKVLRGNGFNEVHAVAITANVTRDERDDCTSHGLRRLLGIVEARRKGRAPPDAELVITGTAPTIVKVDVGGAFSPPAFGRALPLLMEKTCHSGIAALAINRCVHFSTLFANAEPLTEVGLVALATTSDHAWVAPTGKTQPPFGANLIAFDWPCGEKPPFIFNITIGATVRGEIQLHRWAGKAVPEGRGIDDDGRAATDTQAIPDGAILTSGEHEGSALAAMMELLVRPFIGDMTSVESLAWDKRVGGLPYGGGLILALDPARSLGREAPQHLARAERSFAGMQRQGARLPGERRYHFRTRTTCDDVEIAHSLFKDIPALVK